MNIFTKFTLRTLNKNKTRTLVTIIGIILAVAMLTAVTISVSSLMKYLQKGEIATNGNWYGVIYDMTKEDAQKLEDKSNVDECNSLQNMGYAKAELSQDAFGSRPYMYVGGMGDAFAQNMSIHIVEGRLPKSENELIVTDDVLLNLKTPYKVGDTVQLNVGQRTRNGKVLGLSDEYVAEADESQAEKLVNEQSKTYTIVGVYKRSFAIQNYNSPAYVALTYTGRNLEETQIEFFTTKKPKDVYSVLQEYGEQYVNFTNESLLRYMGASKNDHFNEVVWGLAAILIAIIMVGAISLIYNAFSISVSERTKSFGLLASIGATKRQMRRSVRVEAAFLCLIGVPLGVLSGLLGMVVVFKILTGLVAQFLESESQYGAVITLEPSFAALAIAIVVGIITVFVSAWIPTRRALKVNPIEAIRQNQDITLKARKVRTSKLTLKLFGLEGMLASKNFKRNRKKYRATVASLFISVVLFISACSFQSYLLKGIQSFSKEVDYDISYLNREMTDQEMTDLYNQTEKLDKVQKVSYNKNLPLTISLNEKNMNPKYYDFLKKNADKCGVSGGNTGEFQIDGTAVFINDSEYESYLKKCGFDTKVYMNTKQLTPLIKDQVQSRTYDDEGTVYFYDHMFKKNVKSLEIEGVKDDLDGYYLLDRFKENGKVMCRVENENGDEKVLEESDVVIKDTIAFGERIQKGLFSVPMNNYTKEYILLLYPYSAYSAFISQMKCYSNRQPEDGTYEKGIYVKAKEHKAVYQDMEAFISTTIKKKNNSSFYDNAADEESNRAMVAVVNLFAYGFVVLISLIAVANVFNTISTNIALRRREFAMLSSVGLTNKSFYKMMNFECILYGCKSLLFGLPVAFGVTYLIYRSMNNGLSQNFYIPWTGVVIAVFSVFAVVFVTMLYATAKIKKENPIDALKNENL